MKSFLLCTQHETLTGFRLAGVSGRVISPEQLKEALEELINREDIGLIILTEQLMLSDKEYIFELKMTLPDKLIIHIPERGGLTHKDYMMRYINESIGIKV